MNLYVAYCIALKMLKTKHLVHVHPLIFVRMTLFMCSSCTDVMQSLIIKQQLCVIAGRFTKCWHFKHVITQCVCGCNGRCNGNAIGTIHGLFTVCRFVNFIFEFVILPQSMFCLEFM